MNVEGKRSFWFNEEKWNALSHGIGVLFGVFGLYLLLDKDAKKTEYSTIAIVVYSMSFILLFLISTLYHKTSRYKLKKRLRVLDHIGIYFLIAGTYTPVALILLEKGHGWLIFYCAWTITAIGTVLKLFFTGKYEAISLLLYLAMGWMIVLDFQNLLSSTSSLGITLLFLGGGFYTLGILFYAWERMPFNHFVWHLFVLGGAISHWFFIFYAVV